MRVVSGAVAAAIEGAGRVPVDRVTIAWDLGSPYVINASRLLASASTDRGVADTPEEMIGLVNGGTRAAATIVLSGRYVDEVDGAEKRATDLVPTREVAWSTRNNARYCVGSAVTVESGFDVAGVVTYVQTFKGVITDFSISGDEVTITCLDDADDLRAKVDLPAAGGVVVGSGYQAIDGSINPLAVEDLALRAGGMCLTPPLRAGAVVSIPGVGSPLPERGQYRPPTGPVSSAAGFRAPEVRNYGYATDVPHPLVTDDWLCAEGWVKCLWPGLAAPLFLITNYLGVQSFELRVTPTGGLRAQKGTTVLAAPAGAFLPSNSWTYVGVAFKMGTSGSAQIRVGGTTYTVAGISIDPDILDPAVDLGGYWSNAFVEGFQVWKTRSAPTWNDTWIPNYQAQIERTDARLSAVPPLVGVDAWALIQEITAAEGAVAQFDEDGVYRRETRATWNARRFAPPARTITTGPVYSLGVSWSNRGVRASVEAKVTTPRVERSTLTSPVWAATEIYTCPGKRTVTYDITTDVQMFDLRTVVLAQHQDSTNASFRIAVPSTSVGDPAATPVSGVRVKIRPTPEGIRLTIQNTRSFAVSLWTPGNGGSIPAGPYMVVHGQRIVTPEAKTLTARASSIPGVSEVLTLPDNPWRQSEAPTAFLLRILAQDCRRPQIVLDQAVTIASDPRIQIGDVVCLDDSHLENGDYNPSRLFEVPFPFLVVGVGHSLPSEDKNTTTLALRAAYDPTGWTLGVPGRSELGITTTLL